MSKRELFAFAGIATDRKNITKVRYTNNLQNRLLTFKQFDFTNIYFVELPSQMTKIEACKYLLTLTEFKDFEFLIQDEFNKRKVELK